MTRWRTRRRSMSAAAVSAAAVLSVAVLVSSCATSEPEASDPVERASTSTTSPTAGGIDQPIACDTVASACTTHGSDVGLTVTGPPAEPTSIMPSPGSPLATIDRDAGISVPLSDGSLLWLFGDTAARVDDGTIEYFIIGTGAWAAAGAPAVTLDVVDPATGEPAPLAEPTDKFPPCAEVTQRRGMWPTAAIVDRVGERDRVVIWLQNVCLGADVGAGPVLQDRGMAVAEWWYDLAAPPAGTPIRATVLRQVLFPSNSFGVAAVRGPDDEVYTYRCAVPPDGQGSAADYGPCGVARTTLAGVTDPGTYAPWDGTGFSTSDDERAIDLPAGAWSPFPAGGFTVAHDPVVGAYVMVYSPWPGWNQVVELRVASSPLGPWSTPVTVRLPGCEDRIGSREFACYAATAQPAFSRDGAVGIGYYDSSVSTFPTRGSYRVTTVPVTVTG